MLTAGLLNPQYVGLDPRAKEDSQEDGNQIEIMQSDLIRTAEEKDQ